MCEVGISPICAASSVLCCLSAAVKDLEGEGFDDNWFVLKRRLCLSLSQCMVLLVHNRNVQIGAVSSLILN